MISYDEAVSRCWAEVNLTRLAQNYRNARKLLNKETQMICVLKANAYGLGAPVAARRLWAEGQRQFAVASYNEAAQILDVLEDARVLILGLCSETQLTLAVQKGMRITVFSSEYASKVCRAARLAGKKAVVHIKLETGLNRLGLEPAAAVDVITALHQSEDVILEGLFTHLALRNLISDRKQLDLLNACCCELEKRSVHIPLVHALDSIGMVRYPADQLGAVRLGAWLYGVYPRGYAHPEESQLTMTVKTRIAQIHHVLAGECLGYDETHPLKRDSRIATLSAGYIDGYPRLNSVGEVEIRGHRAPVVGLVCMDQMMVDITGIPDAEQGDEVILLGGSIGIDEYARWGNLNRNESLARIGNRVPRVYLEDNQVTEIIDGLYSGG